jgi:hypothetical protein
MSKRHSEESAARGTDVGRATARLEVSSNGVTGITTSPHHDTTTSEHQRERRERDDLGSLDAVLLFNAPTFYRSAIRRVASAPAAWRAKWVEPVSGAS